LCGARGEAARCGWSWRLSHSAVCGTLALACSLTPHSPQGDADSAIDKLWAEKRTAVNQNF